VPLVDFVTLQESHSEHGIPGAEVFLDHVHPTVDSHRMLALEILRTMKDQGTLDSLPGPSVVDEVTRRVHSRIDPHRHAAALANLSKVLGWAGKIQDAYRLAVQGAQMSPSQASVQYQAGLCAQLLGRKEEAVRYYRQTVELDPSAAQAHGNLGVALEDLGQLQEAVRHFELAIQHGDDADIERNRRNLDRVRQRLARSAEAIR
jgi:tetratricopeptide (TPR) repeat protein